jgi:hypothetical protein
VFVDPAAEADTDIGNVRRNVLGGPSRSLSYSSCKQSPVQRKNRLAQNRLQAFMELLVCAKCSVNSCATYFLRWAAIAA